MYKVDTENPVKTESLFNSSLVTRTKRKRPVNTGLFLFYKGLRYIRNLKIAKELLDKNGIKVQSLYKPILLNSKVVICYTQNLCYNNTKNCLCFLVPCF